MKPTIPAKLPTASEIADKAIAMLPEWLAELDKALPLTERTPAQHLEAIKSGSLPISQCMDHNCLVSAAFESFLGFEPCETGGPGPECADACGCMHNSLSALWDEVMAELVKRGYQL